MLVVEVLNKLVAKPVNKGIISTLKVGNKKVDLSHLQFADDTIIFCPQSEDTVRNYRRILQCFQIMYALSINFDKSAIILINCDLGWARTMRGMLGCGKESLSINGMGYGSEG